MEGRFTLEVYETIRDGAVSSAAAVVPLLLDQLAVTPLSVVDVGCGEGHWGAEFLRAGAAVVGIDREDATPPFPLVKLDLANEQLPPADPPFDLAVCLEAAEHLPESRAESFVAELCANAAIIMFSAAIPGQGGHGHLNEQWPGYWAALFDEQGYEVSGAMRWLIWEDDRVENWYRQNLLICVRDREAAPTLFNDSPGNRPLPVVHPVLFEARRA